MDNLQVASDLFEQLEKEALYSRRSHELRREQLMECISSLPEPYLWEWRRRRIRHQRRKELVEVISQIEMRTSRIILYKEALDQIAKGDYAPAIELLEAIIPFVGGFPGERIEIMPFIIRLRLPQLQNLQAGLTALQGSK